MSSLKIGGHLRTNLWVYLVLTSGTLLSWVPLFGHYYPVADDFAFLQLGNGCGFSGVFHQFGFWRLLPNYLTWIVLRNPNFHPVLVLATHLLAVILLFHVCRSLFGGVRLPLFAALVFAMFPFGYQALVWVCACQYILAVLFFLANLLLLTNHTRINWPTPTLFVVSAFLALLTVLSNECLFFSAILSGCFVWNGSPRGALRIPGLVRGRGVLTWAPLVGCAIWVALFYSFKGSVTPKHITEIRPASILGVYFRQYSLFDIFVPLSRPVCRQFMFADWNYSIGTAIVACGVVFLTALCCLPKNKERNLPATTSYTLAAILALLFGASLIYVLGGGFSLDTRKKYPLIILLLLLGCWIYRTVFKTRHVSTRAFLAGAAIVFGTAAITTWLIVGIWKHESACYNSLADCITERNIHGNIEVRWHPDLYRAWPQMLRTWGYRLDDTWVMNLAVEFRGGGDPVTNSCSTSTVVEYDQKTSGWVVGNR
jgi:hypothetical protein